MEPVFDDDYITMDPLYAEPPEEDDTDTLKAERSESPLRLLYVGRPLGIDGHTHHTQPGGREICCP